MATFSTTVGASLLREVIAPEVSVTHYQNDFLFDFPTGGPAPQAQPDARKLNGIIPWSDTLGGTSQKWPIEYAADDAEEFQEGDTPQAPASQSYAQASLSPRYFRTVLEVYRELLDAARDEGQIVDILTEAFDGRLRAMRNTINTTLLGTGAGNIMDIVDSTAAYAGISPRATYGFAAVETAVNGALALSDYEDLIEDVNDRGGDLSEYVFLMRTNQITNTMNLGGWSGNSVVQKITEPGGMFDPSFARAKIAIGGIPAIGVGTMDTQTILLLHIPSFSWKLHVDLVVEEKPTQLYANQWQMVLAFYLKCKQPRLCGKLTGVTA